MIMSTLIFIKTAKKAQAFWMLLLLTFLKLRISMILECFQKNTQFTNMTVNCKHLHLNFYCSIRESRKVQTFQKGVVRTNCLDCLDRTNVFQSKVCFRIFEDVLKQQFLSDNRLSILLTNMWALSGDFISKIYAGTHSVLTSITLKGKENMFDKIDHGVTSVRRFLK